MDWLKKIFPFAWPFILGIILGFISLSIIQDKKIFKSKFLSPISLSPQILSSKIPSKKNLIGFLPFWSVNEIDIPYHLIDELAYFSLSLNSDGSIKKIQDYYAEPGWHKFNSDTVKQIFKQAKLNNVRLCLTITAFDNKIIDNIISNPQAGETAINNILKLITDYKLDSINLDFEYNLSQPKTENSSQLYSNFIEKLKFKAQEIDPEIKISVDLYANAFIKNQPYDVKLLQNHADQLVLMGYDFHQTNSPNSGPVAPIKSETGKSITDALQAIIDKEIKSDKVVLAIPFYGYEWQTTNHDYKASVFPHSGTMASYKRVHQLIKEKDMQINWDNLALSPWLSYEENGIIKQIYFENDQSISLKLQLADQVNLGGIAIWALGYEGKNATVWQVIENWRLQNQN